ncbi:hypothetical protein M404DRAFT_1004485 [Pisolithus tinctorius Marx 270]|uniref:Uncharacterized protein n=1 Tax=Pisolithus tinctorius Marx 270 TaxID=870435 RepID=A0A0C3NX71_PISTI|nr:hypothetical protein M404DRAFT_1004485 [Pisolithus tinctorius Marx 270]
MPVPMPDQIDVSGSRILPNTPDLLYKQAAVINRCGAIIRTSESLRTFMVVHVCSSYVRDIIMHELLTFDVFPSMLRTLQEQ